VADAHRCPGGRPKEACGRFHYRFAQAAQIQKPELSGRGFHVARASHAITPLPLPIAIRADNHRHALRLHDISVDLA
jgi:hypothetical protein